MVTAMTHEWQVATYNASITGGARPPAARPPSGGPVPMDVSASRP
jgi:hypothetical protein